AQIVQGPLDGVRKTKAEYEEAVDKYARSQSHRSSFSEYPTPRWVTIGSSPGLTAFSLRRIFLICASTVRSMLASGDSQASSMSWSRDNTRPGRSTRTFSRLY